MRSFPTNRPPAPHRTPVVVHPKDLPTTQPRTALARAALQDLTKTQRNGVIGWTLKHEIRALVTMLASADTKLFFKGSGAYTDGKMISLPEIEPTQIYPERLAKVLRGYNNHECAHIRYTDFSEIGPYLARVAAAFPVPKALAAHLEKLAHSVFNIIEDSMIERRIGDEFPGARANIDALRDYVTKEAVERLAAPPGLRNDALNALLMVCSRTNRWSSQPLAETIVEDIRSRNPAAVAIAEAHQAEVAALTATSDVMALALTITGEILALASVAAEPEHGTSAEPPPADDGGGQTPSVGNDGSATPDSKSKDAGDAGAPSDDSSPPGADAPKTPPAGGGSGDPAENDASRTPEPEKDAAHPGDASQRDSGASTGDTEPGKGDTDDAPPPGADANGRHSPSKGTTTPVRSPTNGPQDLATDDKAGAPAGAEPTDKAGLPPNPASDRVPQKPGENAQKSALDRFFDDPGPNPGEMSIDAVIKEIKDLTNALKAKLKSAGLTPARMVIRGVQNKRVVSTNAMRRTPADPRVARAIRTIAMTNPRIRVNRRLEDGDFDTKNILSQALGLPDIYKQTTRAPAVKTDLLLLIDQSGSTCDIIDIVMNAASALSEATYAIPTMNSAIVTYTTCHQNPEILSLQTIKDFGDTPARARAAMAAWMDDRGGMSGTPTGEAMLEAGNMLSRRTAPRKVLLLITDGSPSDVGLAQAAHMTLKRLGITTIAVEIGDHHLAKMTFDAAIVVKDTSDLPQAITALGKEIITGRN